MKWPDELRDDSRASNWLNKLLKMAKATQIVSGPNVRLSQSDHGTSLEVLTNPVAGGSPGTVRIFSSVFM